LARRYLAVRGPDNLRYDDMLHGFIVTAHPDFYLLRGTLFTGCEQEYGETLKTNPALQTSHESGLFH
jgi:hypothetical protein